MKIWLKSVLLIRRNLAGKNIQKHKPLAYGPAKYRAMVLNLLRLMDHINVVS